VINRQALRRRYPHWGAGSPPTPTDFYSSTQWKQLTGCFCD